MTGACSDSEDAATGGGRELAMADGMRRFAWTIEGQYFKPHSNPEWRFEEASGVIEAESAGEALEKAVHGLDVDDSEAIPWDLFDDEKEIVIKIQPIGDEDAATAGED